MNQSVYADASALGLLRSATSEHHRRLEARFDAVELFSDPARHPVLASGYAALHLPAEAALAPWLEEMGELEFGSRRRYHLLAAFHRPTSPPHPEPESRSEALGMMYVLEGSTLGGRIILRELAKRGIDISELGYLDPYGADTGRRWRAFVSVLEAETAGDPSGIEEACSGAVKGFLHAEHVLCGG